MSTSDAATVVVEEIRHEFRKLKDQAEAAMAQIDDEAFFASPGSEGNSIAIIVKHVGSNLRSRWTDFFDADGEKPDRNRDGEFELAANDTRESLMAVPCTSTSFVSCSTTEDARWLGPTLLMWFVQLLLGGRSRGEQGV